MSEVVNLEELCTGIIDCPHSTPKWQDKGIPVIRNYNLKDGKIDCTNLSFVSEEDYKERVKRAIPEESDIIISREAPMGVVGIVPKEFQCCLGQRLVLLKIDKSKCIPKYLLYTLMSEYVQVQIRRINQTGSIVSNLNISSLKKLKIPLHNFEEQRKIANILSAIDDKIQINNQINQELEAMAKTLYDYWFVQFDFPDQNGKPYKSSGGKMVYNPELKREIPEGWGVEKLKYFLTIKNGKDHKNLQDGKFAVYGSGGIMRSVTDYLYSGESILFPRKGTLNNVMYVNEKFWTVDTMFYSEVNKNNSALYVFYSVKDIDFNKLNTGTGVPSMTSSILYDLNIIVPEENILEKFNTVVKRNYETIKLNNIQNQELIQLRDWLLPMLMNGQVYKRIEGKND
jgi:sty sbli